MGRNYSYGKPGVGINHSYNKPEYRLKQRNAHLGNKNPAWKGGTSRNSRIFDKIRPTLKQQCSLCGATEKLVMHHIDNNFLNNELSNLIIVCRGCHNRIHKSKKEVYSK